MSLDFAFEVWDVLKTHIDFSERKDAADSLVSFLIDNNYEPSEIKEAFTGDKELLSSLKDYLEDHDHADEYDDEYEEDEDAEDDWD